MGPEKDPTATPHSSGDARKTVPPVPRSDCILWDGYLDPDGYGRVDGQGAHRIAWEDKRGDIPPGMTIDHVVCRVHQCINPDHMELVTRAENARRRWAHQKGTPA